MAKRESISGSAAYVGSDHDPDAAGELFWDFVPLFSENPAAMSWHPFPVVGHDFVNMRFGGTLRHKIPSLLVQARDKWRKRIFLNYYLAMRRRSTAAQPSNAVPNRTIEPGSGMTWEKVWVKVVKSTVPLGIGPFANACNNTSLLTCRD